MDLRSFIDLSLHEADTTWEEWIASFKRDVDVKCWERKNCGKKECPAYQNSCGRCWLIAGTMCCGEVTGKFALKYGNCTKCDIYQQAVFGDPVAEIYEHLITLVHSLRLKQDELKMIATRDLLTGLYNRNYFELVMAQEMEKVKRYGGRLSLVLIDVDNFKQINDNYGHLHGDGVLRECALILNKAVRSSDTLVRLGGDEFLIIMPETECNEKDILIQRINGCVKEWNGKYASQGYDLSLSFGCSVLEQGKELLEVLSEADALMYKDKTRKRQR